MTRSYVTSLRKGRIENPGFEKLRAIAKAMNFPPELWFEDITNLREVSGARPSWFVDGEDKLTLLDEDLERISKPPVQVLGQTNARPKRRYLASIASASLSTITPRIRVLKCTLRKGEPNQRTRLCSEEVERRT